MGAEKFYFKFSLSADAKRMKYVVRLGFQTTNWAQSIFVFAFSKVPKRSKFNMGRAEY